MIEVPNKGRDDIPQMCKERGYKVGAEIGVWKGEFSEQFLKLGLFMFCVDAWTPYKGYKDFQLHRTLNAARAEAFERLKNYECDILTMFSAEAVQHIPDGHLDFVYIDANHSYEGLSEDLNLWVPKVRVGGMVAGHDYDPLRRQNGIQKALIDYTTEHKIDPVFVLGRSEAVAGEVRDETRSWMWIR